MTAAGSKRGFVAEIICGNGCFVTTNSASIVTGPNAVCTACLNLWVDVLMTFPPTGFTLDAFLPGGCPSCGPLNIEWRTYPGLVLITPGISMTTSIPVGGSVDLAFSVSCGSGTPCLFLFTASNV